MANDTSAFPHEHQYTRGQQGMTLRDWFAGQALNGRLADGTDKDAQLVAEEAYAYAQAMLVERQKYEDKP
jgi:hypothetical protein